MRILVTGGLGFIGSNFINLIAPKAEVEAIINLDAGTYAANSNNIDENARKSGKYKLYLGNVCDADLVGKIIEMENIDTIVHFAAESHVDRSIENASVFIETNVLGTFTLLDQANRKWKSYDGKRFLHISTDEVFGSLDLLDPPFRKTNPYAPNSPYAASKASADLICRSFYKTHGFPVMITNCSNNYGPRQYPEKLIPLALSRLKEGKQVPVYGDGSNIRDWIYVEDHCVRLWQVLKLGNFGGQYLIGGNNEVSNLWLVRILCKMMNKSPDDHICFVPDRKGHDFRYAIDTTDFDATFGKLPYTPADDGIKQTIAWYARD
jgi:dTDP-glucose 4,6-dehydratase